MPEINLGPTPSSTSRLGVAITVTVLVLLAGALAYYYAHQVAHASVSHVETYPVQVNFNTFSIALGKQTEDDLYILATLRIQNGYKVPLFLQDFKGTLINSSGEQLNSDALQKKDIPEVVRMFPAMKPLTTPTLDRETEIAPGATAEGMVVLQYPITKEVWDKKQSASLTVSFYHQVPLTVPIP